MSEDVFSTFDWDWSDGYPAESARAQALQNRPRHTCLIARVCEGDSLVNFALWNELPKGHPVGELWLETQTDLHGSIYLAYGGYFRQALAVLRLWFEMAVNGVYFAKHYKQPTSRYRQWRAGGRQAPADMSQIAKSLSGRSDKMFKADFADIKQRLEPVYTTLCHHVHGQGLDLYDLQNGRDNVPRFLEQSFDIWFEMLNQVFGTICFLYRLFYAKELGAYLSRSKSELQHALTLKRVLNDNAPDFSLLITEAVSELNPKEHGRP